MFYIASISTAVSSLVFGCSVNLSMAIASRVFLGLMNPTVGLIKTVVSELCAPKDQTFAMSVVSASWSIGLVIGPSIGGWASRPAVQYPGTWIANVELFSRFPYLLPNLITAVFCIVSMVMIYLYLPETLGAKVPTKREYEMVRAESEEAAERDLSPTNNFLTDEDTLADTPLDTDSDRVTSLEEGHPTPEGDGKERCEKARSSSPVESEPSDRVDTTDGEEKKQSTLVTLLSIKPVRVSIIAYFLLSYIAIVYDEIGKYRRALYVDAPLNILLFAHSAVPLWVLSSESKGGLAYDSKQVGFIVSFTGIPMVLFTLFVFPPLARKLGNVQGFKLGVGLFALFSIGVMLAPMLSDWLFSGLISPLPLLLVMTSCAKMATCMAFTCTFLIINASVPSHLRGSANGLAMTFGSIAKAMGPSIGSIVYAASIHSAIPLPFSYLLVFLINGVIAVLTLLLLPTDSLSDGRSDSATTTTGK